MHITFQGLWTHGFTNEPPLYAYLDIHPSSQPTLLRHSIAQTPTSGAGIFSLLSITYSNWPRLRISTNPERINRSLGNLRLSANRNFTYFFVTYTNIFTSLTHLTCPRGQARIYQRTLPYPCSMINHTTSHSFGNSLSPVRSSAQKHSTSELLRFL